MVSGIDRRLRYGQLMILRYLAPFVIYFVRAPMLIPLYSSNVDNVVVFHSGCHVSIPFPHNIVC